jgi:hypothetical protein
LFEAVSVSADHAEEARTRARPGPQVFRGASEAEA